MLDPIRKLLTEAGKAKQVRAFWDAAAAILSEWTGGARVELDYKGLRETGSAQAGIAGQAGGPFISGYHHAEGGHGSPRVGGPSRRVPAGAGRPRRPKATHPARQGAPRAR